MEGRSVKDGCPGVAIGLPVDRCCHRCVHFLGLGLGALDHVGSCSCLFDVPRFLLSRPLFFVLFFLALLHSVITPSLARRARVRSPSLRLLIFIRVRIILAYDLT
jgi:hypothetical protein